MPRRRRKNKKEAAAPKKKKEADTIDSDEDEEIDEDAAFNSDDERKYGSFFAARANNKNKRERANDSDDTDDDIDDDDDDIDSTPNDDKNHSDDSQSDSDDSQSDNGLASEDDDEQDGDGGQYMLDLLNNIDKTDHNHHDDDNHDALEWAQLSKEDPMAVVQQRKKKMTLEDLVDPLALASANENNNNKSRDTPPNDNKTTASLQTALRPLMGRTATAAPASRHLTQRAQRKVQTAHTARDMTGWFQAQQENRQAETLDFRPARQYAHTLDDDDDDENNNNSNDKNQKYGQTRTATGNLVASFAPSTDFEQQMHAALQKAQQTDPPDQGVFGDDIMESAEHQLQHQDYQTRRAELAKLRALLFYHEQKRHHINKIKSKKYRRIRKKQRLQAEQSQIEAGLAQGDAALEQELREKEELDRMQERMTLAHKNTSKWAKRILKRGKNVDVDTRRALSAQIRRGDDLRAKMTARNDDDDDDDDNLLASAHRVLAGMDDDDKNDDKKGLFKLAFMQRGVERQRERAKQEARELLMELRENEALEHESVKDDDHRDDDVTAKKKKKKRATPAELASVLPEGSMVATSLQFGTAATKVQVHVADDSEEPTSTSTFAADIQVQNEAAKVESSSNEETKKKKKKKKKNKKDRPSKADDDDDNAEANPWLQLVEKEAAKKSPSNQRQQPTKASKPTTIDVDDAVELVANDTNATALPPTRESATTVAETPGSEQEASSLPPPKKTVLTLTQEELVRRAFVSDETEADQDFAREKQQITEREDPDNTKAAQKARKEQASGSSGWGSWTGRGAPAPAPLRKLPKKLQPPPPLPKRQRQDQAKPRVILSERRNKRLADQFMIAEIPHPYTSREEYDRAMAGPIGREWNVTSSFRAMTVPKVITRPGQIIQPISKRMKESRTPAKF